jgi:hypothetical protein
LIDGPDEQPASSPAESKASPAGQAA